MVSTRPGHIERLPSGSYRVIVYAGTDPLTGRRLRFRQTVKTEEQAQILLGKLLEQVAEGRQPETGVTVAELLRQYMALAELDQSTRQTYEGYIRRTILPALGPMELRKVRGPVLDMLYARLHRCGNLACSGKPFTEHSAFPAIDVTATPVRPVWVQVAVAIREAIAEGQLAPGEPLPSARQVADRNGLSVTAVHQALAVLANEGLIAVRQGRRAVVAGEAAGTRPARRARPADTGHDCARSGCTPHTCRPMSAATIRQIHAILSGAFATAVRWEWIDRNPAAAAKLPRVRQRAATSPDPTDVAKVIAAARTSGQDLLALYLWLAAVTGARRGELCALHWADLDLQCGAIRIAHSYSVAGGTKVRKDTKTHQDRSLAIDELTVTVLAERRQAVADQLGQVGVDLPPDSYVFSSHPLGERPWNPDWVTHKVTEIAQTAGVALNTKALRHYSASQLLAGGIDLRNTAARLGHGGGGATTLRHYADPVSEVDRRAAAYLAQLTADSATSRVALPAGLPSQKR
jgi:integrase